MTRLECQSKYGEIKNGKWPDELKHMCFVVVPKEIRQICLNSLSQQPWSRVYCNKDMARPLQRALNNLVLRGVYTELKTFDGCFNIRDTRGEKGKLSAHAWGGAIDLNTKENPLGGPCRLSKEFIACFTDEGFVHGMSFHREDPMHFSWFGF